MENNSEFGQLFLNLFLTVRDENEGRGVIPSALCPLHQVFQLFRRKCRRAAHNPEMIALGTSDEGRAVIFLDFQDVVVRVEDQEKGDF